MQLELFINFNGNCRQAVEFYSKVFRSPVENLMTYGEMPPNSGMPPVPEADRDKIMYAGIKIGGIVAMFMDGTSEWPVTMGDNINPTISSPDKDEITRLFNELGEGGSVLQDLEVTFWSPWYGMVKDQFDVVWQLMQYDPEGSMQ